MSLYLENVKNKYKDLSREELFLEFEDKFSKHLCLSDAAKFVIECFKKINMEQGFNLNTVLASVPDLKCSDIYYYILKNEIATEEEIRQIINDIHFSRTSSHDNFDEDDITIIVQSQMEKDLKRRGINSIGYYNKMLHKHSDDQAKCDKIRVKMQTHRDIQMEYDEALKIIFGQFNRRRNK